VSHGQDPEQEAPIENVRLFFDGGCQFIHPPFDFLAEGGLPIHLRETGAEVVQHGDLFAARVVGVIARHLVGVGVAAGKGGGKNHTGVVTQSVGQPPAIG
jgi:hypothetical protein